MYSDVFMITSIIMYTIVMINSAKTLLKREFTLFHLLFQGCSGLFCVSIEGFLHVVRDDKLVFFWWNLHFLVVPYLCNRLKSPKTKFNDIYMHYLHNKHWEQLIKYIFELIFYMNFVL